MVRELTQIPKGYRKDAISLADQTLVDGTKTALSGTFRGTKWIIDTVYVQVEGAATGDADIIDFHRTAGVPAAADRLGSGNFSDCRTALTFDFEGQDVTVAFAAIQNTGGNLTPVNIDIDYYWKA